MIFTDFFFNSQKYLQTRYACFSFGTTKNLIQLNLPKTKSLNSTEVLTEKETCHSNMQNEYI